MDEANSKDTAEIERWLVTGVKHSSFFSTAIAYYRTVLNVGGLQTSLKATRDLN